MGEAGELQHPGCLPSAALHCRTPARANVSRSGAACTGWLVQRTISVHFTFPGKCNRSWLQTERRSLMLLQETGEGRGSWGEFLGSGPQPRSRSGKNVAEGLWEGLARPPSRGRPNWDAMVWHCRAWRGGVPSARNHVPQRLLLGPCPQSLWPGVQGDRGENPSLSANECAPLTNLQIESINSVEAVGAERHGAYGIRSLSPQHPLLAMPGTASIQELSGERRIS